MSARPAKPARVTEAKIVRDLEAIRAAAMEAGAFAPALRAAELLGRHIGMWTRETAQPQDSLADLIARAVAGAGNPATDK